MRIDRLPRLPPICEHPTPDTSLDNFDVFTRTWAENYISFDLKHVDWDSIASLNRSKVAPGMPAAQLFDLFEAMINPFGDAHTFINAPKLKRRFRGIRPGTDRVVNELAGRGGFDKFQKSGMRNYSQLRIQDTFTALSENFVTNRLNMVTSVAIPATSESCPSAVIRSRVILQLA
jgi:hypothetical protein